MNRPPRDRRYPWPDLGLVPRSGLPGIESLTGSNRPRAPDLHDRVPCGFGDLSGFNRAFKRPTQSAPTSYATRQPARQNPRRPGWDIPGTTRRTRGDTAMTANPLRKAGRGTLTSLTTSPGRINEIVHGQRRITADTALRLSRYFGTSGVEVICIQPLGDQNVNAVTSAYLTNRSWLAPIRAFSTRRDFEK